MDRPTFFSPQASEGASAAVNPLLIALGQKRIATEKEKMLNWLASKEAGTGQLRYPPKGQPVDTLMANDWVPQAWKAEHCVPESIQTFGSPWMLVGGPGSARLGASKWPCMGIGQFLVVVHGAITLASWPLRAVMEQTGATIQKSTQFLFQEMSTGALKKARQ